MKKYYITLVSLFIVGCLIALYLSKKPITKGEGALPETVKATKAIEQEITVSLGGKDDPVAKEIEVADTPSSTPYPSERLEASRLFRTFEEFSKIEMELIRIRQMRGGFSEEERRQRRILDMHLGILCSLLMDVAVDEGKRDLLEDFRLIVDYRDGELRLPTIRGYHELSQLIKQPELTDDDRATIRQIIHDLNASAKTNTPTSAFQMPTTEE